MRRANQISAFMVSLLCAGSLAQAGQDVGLPVGASAPEFTLQDQRGNPRSLEALRGGGKLAIVFFRSADW